VCDGCRVRKFDNVLVDQVVVVLVGTNNHGHTPDMIANGIVAIVQLIREKQPQAHVVAMVS
jgi:platelet-activating factor acetylhydrolase IB subunit beta/gamma